MVDFVNSQIYSGQALGLADGYQRNFSPQGKAARATAYAVAEEQNQRLQRAKATKLNDQDLATLKETESQQIENLRLENEQLLGQLTRNKIFDSFDRYTGDNDTRHLNVMFKEMRSNKYGQKLFGDMTRVDKLTEQDKMLIEKAGLDADLVLANPEFSDRLVKVTLANGDQQLTDMADVFRMTGYYKFAEQRELDILKQRADIAKKYQGSNGLAKTADERLAYDTVIASGIKPDDPEFEAAYLAERQRMQEAKANRSLSDKPMQSYKSENEREAFRKVMQEGYEPGTDEFNSRFIEVHDEIIARNQTPSSVRVADEVDTTTQKIESKAQSMGKDFFDLDFSDSSLKRKFEPEVQRLEKLGGFELSTDQRKELGYVKSLLTLGPPSLELTDKETGIIDNIFFNVKKYMSDNVEGIDATSSYATFRNTIRHALYGATLTEGEIKSFEEQFGNLKQQRGPVLAQLKTAIQQVQAKLDSINALGNSYVTHFRLGQDQDQLNTIVDNLDKLIQTVNQLEQSETNVADDTPVSTTELTPQDLQTLDGIFGG